MSELTFLILFCVSVSQKNLHLRATGHTSESLRDPEWNFPPLKWTNRGILSPALRQHCIRSNEMDVKKRRERKAFEMKMVTCFGETFTWRNSPKKGKVQLGSLKIFAETHITPNEGNNLGLNYFKLVPEISWCASSHQVYLHLVISLSQSRD